MNGEITLKIATTRGQKTTWMRYLLIMVFSVFAFSCDERIDEPIQRASYIYLNKLLETVRFKLYESLNNSSVEYVLLQGDSIEFSFSGTPGVFPFYGNEIANRLGDSVTLGYEKGTCNHYVRDKSTGVFGGTGVFDLSSYENYNLELVNQRNYTLRYFIDEKDFSLAEPCD
jgi:hypothetical protein